GLVDTGATTWADQLPEVVGIGDGATGIASLSEGPAGVLAEFSAEFGIPAVAAIDAVTAHLGALDGRGGAITVLGTGAIAIGHPGSDDHGHWCPGWSRVDGWGHLFGDRGGGAWLGRLGRSEERRGGEAGAHRGGGRHTRSKRDWSSDVCSSDLAVPAHLGALDGRGGAITVLGTGAIAIGHPGSDDHGHWCPGWSRVDGWGHLFGDRGGGAWLGRLGLDLALRTHDGVDEYGSVLL